MEKSQLFNDMFCEQCYIFYIENSFDSHIYLLRNYEFKIEIIIERNQFKIIVCKHPLKYYPYYITLTTSMHIY